MEEFVLLHVGYQKTGSTWLQRNVFNNEGLGFGSKICHENHEVYHDIVLSNEFTFDPKMVREKYSHYIDESLKKGLVPVISHESFAGDFVNGRYYGKEVANRLKLTFPNSKVLITIREQRSLILSAYLYYLFQDGVERIEHFIGVGKESPGFVPICRAEYIEYHHLYRIYCDLFGKENVLVLPFEKLKIDNNLFCNDILQHCNIKRACSINTEPANANLPVGVLLFKRYLNHIARIGSYNRPPSIMLKIARKIIKGMECFVPEFVNSYFKANLNAYINDYFQQKFVESNRELENSIGVDLKVYGYQ
ncbi:hypothetical protein [Methylomonas sp. MgM2]